MVRLTHTLLFIWVPLNPFKQDLSTPRKIPFAWKLGIKIDQSYATGHYQSVTSQYYRTWKQKEREKGKKKETCIFPFWRTLAPLRRKSVHRLVRYHILSHGMLYCMYGSTENLNIWKFWFWETLYRKSTNMGITIYRKIG